MTSEKAVVLLKNGQPVVLTLCDYCEKEFPIPFQTQTQKHQWVSSYVPCPHCNEMNKRWLRILGEKKEGSKLRRD